MVHRGFDFRDNRVAWLKTDFVDIRVAPSAQRHLVVGGSAGRGDGRGSVVTVRVDRTGTGGRGVVAGVGAIWLNLLVNASGTADGSTGVGGVVAGAGVGVSDRETTSACSSAELSLTSGVLVLASEEALAPGAGGVAVGWARSEALLLLVVSDEDDLHDGGDEENDGTDNGDSKASLVHAASSTILDTVSGLVALNAVGSEAEAEVVLGSANGGADNARARSRAFARQNCKGDEATDEGDVENNSEECEKADTAKAAGQEDSEDGVHHRNA